MSMTWEGASGIVCGQVITNKCSPNAVRPEIFFPPYDDVIKAYKNGVTEIEDLIEICGLSPVQYALDAVKDINGLNVANWISILERSCALYEAGRKLEQLGRKAQRGEQIDWSIVRQYETKALEGIGGEFIPLSKIEAREVPFIPSGWNIIDEHLGGIPGVGLTLIGGEPGVGKTTFMAKFVKEFANYHKQKKVAVFSAEMIRSELAMRFNEVGKMPESVKERILLNDYPVTVDELINKASAIEGLGLICVDFIDMLIKEASETEYSKAYLTLVNGAKKMNIPILVIAQLIKYSGGLPRKKHLRYTRMAEAFPGMILMLYDPATSSNADDEDDTGLPLVDGTAFILCWKVRGGFRKHLDEAPGAIQVGFRGDRGWGSTKSKWHSLKKIA